MKYLNLIIAFVFSGILFVNSYAQNPYDAIGKKSTMLTLTKGKYPEYIPYDSIQRIGSIIINVKQGTVVAFLDRDSITFNPEISSRWWSIDPKATKYPDLSPYNFVGNSPIQYVDPDGGVIVDPKTGEQVQKVNGQWKTVTGGEVSKQFVKNSQPVLDKLTQYDIGNQIYDQLQNINTIVVFDLNDENNLASSEEKGGTNSEWYAENYETNGKLYEKVVITPMMKNLEESAKKNGVDFDEKFLQTISVEKDHILTTDQISKEQSYDYTFDTPQKFSDVYNSLLNEAIRVGKTYRNEIKKPIDASSNQPIDNVKSHPSGIGSELKIEE